MFRHAAISLALVTSTLGAQDRETTTPVESRTFWNYSPAQIGTLISQGFRLSDLEAMPTNPIRFSGTAVENTGEFKTDWWWFYGLTRAQMMAEIHQRNARPIDVERYLSSVGSERFACVMVDNSGANAKTWWWWSGQTFAQVPGLTTGVRFVDVEVYEVAGQKRVDLIAIANTGKDARSWWYYINYGINYIDSKVAANNARPIDLERLDNGNYACLMIRDDLAPWWWYRGISFANVLAQESYHEARVIDYEFYLDGGTPKSLAILIDNFENFESFGSGCHGVVQDIASGHALIGTVTEYRGKNLVPAKPGVLNVGLSKLNVPLPGAPGCFLLASPDIDVAFVTPGSGTAIVLLPLPYNPALVGLEFHTQFVGIAPNANSLGVVASNGLTTVVRG